MTEQQADKIITHLKSIDLEISQSYTYRSDLVNKIGMLDERLSKVEKLLITIYSMLDDRLPEQD